MRLTREEAAAIAARWVASHYPVVPPIVGVYQLSERSSEGREPRLGPRSYLEDRSAAPSQWMVAYLCSRETDALGMPQSLRVLVDDATGFAELDPMEMID